MEMIAAHGGGHGQGVPCSILSAGLFRVGALRCRSCFRPRMFGGGVTSSSKLSELSIRVYGPLLTPHKTTDTLGKVR